MQQLSLQVRLSMLGAPALGRVLEVDPPDRRQTLVDEGASPELVNEIDGLMLAEHEAILLDAVRMARDMRSVDPLRDAELSRRPAWTSPYSKQDIAERSG